MDASIKSHAGYVAIVGRPNVGKSTLLNKILGTKISITANKSQTTRHKIIGVKTVENFQTIYVDTPGIQKNITNRLGSYMNQVALGVLNDVDVIVLIVVGNGWRNADELVLQIACRVKCPIILAINKIDLISQKNNLLSYIEKITTKYKFAACVPLSAHTGDNLDALEKEVKKILPVNPFFFPTKQVTDRDINFLIAEIIREKLTRFLGQELPYVIAVVINQLELNPLLVNITATIYVERQGQKVIIIGIGGERLKKIGMLARKDIENLFARKVFLRLWVKIKSNWTRNKELLRYLGYE
ncbi:MAG: GTPase Era [Coxiellaceae bacterium]|nr:GTPase Era [Coxiellaceae bacterium]